MNLNRLLVGSVLGLLFLVMGGSLFLLVRENHDLKEAAAMESQSDRKSTRLNSSH